MQRKRRRSRRKRRRKTFWTASKTPGARTEPAPGRTTMTDDKARGGFEQARGNGGETVGNLTGDDRMAQEGKLDYAKRNLERGMGVLKDAAGPLKDQVADG